MAASKSRPQPLSLPLLLVISLLGCADGDPGAAAHGQVSIASADDARRFSADSVVRIDVKDASGETLATAAGVILESSGTVVTVAEPLTVEFASGATIHVSSVPYTVQQVQAIDYQSNLAVLRIGLTVGQAKFSAMPVRRRAPDIGETVYIVGVGNPGETKGIVSSGTIAGVSELSGGRSLIRTSAPGDPLLCGGPVLDGKGNVIAVAASRASSGEEDIRAVPIAQVLSMIAATDEFQEIASLQGQGTLGPLASASSPGSLAPDDLFKLASNSVAKIELKNRYGRIISSGSGFLIDSSGRIVTNAHVLEGGEEATVRLAGAKYTVTHVAAINQRHDLAILRLDLGFSRQEQQPLSFLTGRPKIGQRVYAIGSPQGFENTISDGLVSGWRSDVSSTDMIQTTAPISPGSSGGPLLNQFGRVIGVTTLTFTKGQNLNFAVPAIYVERLLQTDQAPIPLRDL